MFHLSKETNVRFQMPMLYTVKSIVYSRAIKKDKCTSINCEPQTADILKYAVESLNFLWTTLFSWIVNILISNE